MFLEPARALHSADGTSADPAPGGRRAGELPKLARCVGGCSEECWPSWPRRSSSPAPSAAAQVAPEQEVVGLVIEGTGFGHGRGMSQWGAYGRAVNGGQSWTTILNAYYGGTTLGSVSTGVDGCGCASSATTATPPSG